MLSTMLTKKKKQILDYIKKCIKKNDYSPSLEEIAEHFKLVVSTIYQHIDELKRNGYLDKLNNQARTIQVLKDKKFSNSITIPLLGIIAAGQPIETYETPELVTIPKNNIGAGEHFALKVQGNSMVGEGILDGSMVIIKKQNTAQNGDVVVALINGSETTLKKFYQEKNKIKLVPANPTMKSILVDPENLLIQGKVVSIQKGFEISKNQTKTIKQVKDTGNWNVFKKWTNTIQLMDCVEGMRKLPKESIDLIIIDPPYNIGKDFGNNIDKRELDEYIMWSRAWINESIRLLKPTGTLFIYGFSEILAHLSVEIPIKKRWLIWHYTNKNVASLNFWQRSHESIICAWKDKAIFNRDEIREPYTEGFLNGAAGKKRRGTIGRFSKNGKETVYNAHEKGALPRDVIKIPALAGGAGMNERWFLCKTCKDVFEPRKIVNHINHYTIKHPTQKPLNLCKKLIKSAMPLKNGTVLIPFAGSGSECAASKELNQNYIGFEINPDYIKIAKKLISSTRAIPKLF